MTDLADSKREIPRSRQPVELGRLECHGSLLRAGAGPVRVIGFLLRLNRIMVQLMEDTKLCTAPGCRGPLALDSSFLTDGWKADVIDPSPESKITQLRRGHATLQPVD